MHRAAHQPRCARCSSDQLYHAEQGPHVTQKHPFPDTWFQKDSQSHCGPYLSILTNSWAPTDRQKSWSQEGSLLQGPPPAPRACPGACIVPRVCPAQPPLYTSKICLHFPHDVWPRLTLPQKSDCQNLSFKQRPSPCMC